MKIKLLSLPWICRRHQLLQCFESWNWVLVITYTHLFPLWAFLIAAIYFSFTWSSWYASIANHWEFYDSFNYFYDQNELYRCSSSYNQKNKQEINKYDVLYDTSPQYVFIKSSKTNTNCGLDNDRKDNVTTQILRITFCRKLHSLELIKNQAYTCISLTLQSTLLLNSPKRFLKIWWRFYRINH